MFSMVILNKWNVYIMTQNHPWEGLVHVIVKQIKDYGHQQLHITGSIRMKLAHKFKMDYLDIFHAIRNSLGLKPLKIVEGHY